VNSRVIGRRQLESLLYGVDAWRTQRAVQVERIRSAPVRLVRLGRQVPGLCRVDQWHG
jgi:hypothetical protein